MGRIPKVLYLPVARPRHMRRVRGPGGNPGHELGRLLHPQLLAPSPPVGPLGLDDRIHDPETAVLQNPVGHRRIAVVTKHGLEAPPLHGPLLDGRGETAERHEEVYGGGVDDLLVLRRAGIHGASVLLGLDHGERAFHDPGRGEAVQVRSTGATNGTG